MASMGKGALAVVLAAVASTAWMGASNYLILLNRHLMVDLHFSYPMFLSGMGMIASGILSLLCCQLGVVECKTNTMNASLWITKILPVGFFTAVTLWTGNEVYLYLSVSFIQMFKAFTPVITMLCLFFAGLEEPTQKIIWSVLITAGGTALAAYGEVNLSFLGLVISVASAVSESVRLVMTQYLLNGLKFHPIEGLMYSAPACCLWLYAGAAVRELPQMLDSGAFGIMMAHPLKFAAAAVLGFLVNWLAYVSIKLASSLTLKVLGTVKNTLLVVSAVVFMGEVVTMTQAIGYTISLIGFGWYNQIKMKQIAQASEAKAKETSGGASPLTMAAVGSREGSSSPGSDMENGSLKIPLIESRSSSDSISVVNNPAYGGSLTLNSLNQTSSSLHFGGLSINGSTVYGSQQLQIPGSISGVTARR